METRVSDVGGVLVSIRPMESDVQSYCVRESKFEAAISRVHRKLLSWSGSSSSDCVITYTSFFVIQSRSRAEY